MRCSVCSTEFTGNYCSGCGRPAEYHSAPTQSGSQSETLPQPQRRQNGGVFTWVMAGLGLLTLGLGSWFLVTQLTKNHDTGQASPTVATQTSSSGTPQTGSSAPPSVAPSASSTGSAAVSSAGSAQRVAPAPSASSAAASAPTTADAETTSRVSLDKWASDDAKKTPRRDGYYGARLATLWVGQTTDSHPSPWTAAEIAAELNNDKGMYPNVKILKASYVGKQNATMRAHPDAWIIVSDPGGLTSDADARGWCESYFGEHWVDSCGPQSFGMPHS